MGRSNRLARAVRDLSQLWYMLDSIKNQDEMLRSAYIHLERPGGIFRELIHISAYGNPANGQLRYTGRSNRLARAVKDLSQISYMLDIIRNQDKTLSPA